MAHYNEIYTTRGEKRLAYRSLESRTGIDVTDPPAHFVDALIQPGVVGDAELHPVPLVLDQSEVRDVLVPGVLQRAFALQELFADLAMGSKRIAESGLLSGEDLNHILRSEGVDGEDLRRLWRGQTRDQIRFVYGPDLLREPRGGWIPIEDNVGCLGGVADGPVALDTYLEATGIQLHAELAYQNRLKEALITFLKRVGLEPGSDSLLGISGTSSNCADTGDDYQTEWKGIILQSLGVTVDRPERLCDRISAGSLRPSALINLAATLIPAFKRLGGMLFEIGEIPVFGAPCSGLVASKSFHALGDAVVRLYLDEPPLLATPRTQLLRNPPARLPRTGVLKRNNGCGGTEVFFLDEPSDPTTESILHEKLKTWGPCGGVIQDRVSRSVIAPSKVSADLSATVEIRPIVYVYGWRTAVVDSVISGRAIPASSRLGNLSRGGARYLPVICEPVR